MVLCLALTFLYFIITGIQYWVSDYLITELKVEQEVVFVTFSIISITGPVLGVVIGGNVTTFLGGYNSKKSLQICLVVALMCLGSAIPTPFVNNFPLFVVLLWFLLFFGGAILPCMTGIMLSTVDKQYKTIANSIANLSYNLLGYLPAPTVYGLIHDAGEGNNSRWAMGVLMFSPIISIGSLYMGAYLIMKHDILHYEIQIAGRPSCRSTKSN